MPVAIERAVAFVDRNTRHPMRVVGLNRIRLDEYPTTALREALVNAVAHRQYEDGGRKIILEVFPDRIVVSSPGLPPAPITLPSLRRGKYRPCSRNPVLAQSLSFLDRIEERGSGFVRMRNAMVNHGLDEPVIGADTGYFQVVFPGPGDNLDRLRAPTRRLVITPAIEAQLTERQRVIVHHVATGESVTRRWCVQKFRVANDTAGRDLRDLVEKGLLVPQGRGRSVSYGLDRRSESGGKPSK
jgi:predicted HTH transcriptional regulator